MIDEAGRIATHRRIDDKVLINLEHVATDTAAIVVPLALVRQRGADQLTGVLDHHLA